MYGAIEWKHYLPWLAKENVVYIEAYYESRHTFYWPSVSVVICKKNHNNMFLKEKHLNCSKIFHKKA